MNSDSLFSTPETKKCILLVDDEHPVLTVALAILSTMSWDVVTAHCGEEAVDTFKALVARNRKPECVILDLTMPGGLSGFETLQKIKALDDEVPVIACSGYFEDNARELCRALGFADALEKPYTPDSLTTTVRRCIARQPEPDDSFSSSVL